MKEPEKSHESRGKTVKLAIFWGVISIALYLLVFLDQGAVTHHFTKGGVFAIAIIATALVFSFIHGSFANYIIHLSGIRPWQGENKEEGKH